MTIKQVKETAELICEHVDPSGKPICGYYDEKEDIYYITYDAKVMRDKKECVIFKKAIDIKYNLLFDPFSEIKMMNDG